MSDSLLLFKLNQSNKNYFAFYKFFKKNPGKKLLEVIEVINKVYKEKNFDNDIKKYKNELAIEYKIKNDKFKEKDLNAYFRLARNLGACNKKYELSNLSKEILNKNKSIKDFFDVVILNFINRVSDYIYSPLISLLEYIKFKKLNEKNITKKIIIEAFDWILGEKSKNVQNKNKKEMVSYFFNWLRETSYFISESKEKLKINLSIEELLEKCNKTFHGKKVNEVQKEINTENDYIVYITTDNFNSNQIVKNIKNENVKKNKQNNNYQKVYYGAPGTGKSYKLNQEALKNFKEENIRRITFHPNLLYANFIGTYKPTPKDNRNDVITYQYVPGFLIELLTKALKNEEQNFLLIIEEINRANAAAVFGDFFQLMDRNEPGKSEYPIRLSKELQNYLKNELPEISSKTKDFSEIYFPNNFYIWATMNSADQGVTPLDTAFKRRWTFEYIDINENANNVKNQYYFNLAGINKPITWNDFRETINNYLSKTVLINEDKLMGVYFISKNDLEECENDPDGLTSIIKNKVLMYLYEDVCRTYRKKVFNMDKAFSTSELLKNFSKEGLKVFNSDLSQKLRDKINFYQNNESDEEEN